MEKHSTDHILIAFGSLPVIPVPLETRIKLIPMVFYVKKPTQKSDRGRNWLHCSSADGGAEHPGLREKDHIIIRY